MRSEEYYATHDFRGIDRKSGERMSYKETLAAMARYYGKFAGRWHSSQFWAQVAKDEPGMDEAACEAKVRRIERDADAARSLWESHQ